MLYRLTLADIESDRVLYLAIPLDTYQTFFQLDFTKIAVEQYQVKLIVYDSNKEEILKWIS